MKDLRIDADFPGGNIVVDGIEGDVVHLHQDLRDTVGGWFYWYFRIRGAAGRRLRFRFTQGRAMGVHGPAIRSGDRWEWLGAASVSDNGFVHTFREDEGDVRFSFGMPYVAADLERFLAGYRGNTRLRLDDLTCSRHGRAVELLTVEPHVEAPAYRILATCRHHCCEMMANYVLEGLLAATLADDETGRWWEQNARLWAVPFVDKDGVEDGDQGKNRHPHDHNRDYGDDCIYPEVKAIREMFGAGGGGSLDIALDLHCPHISGRHNQNIYIVGSSCPRNWEAQQRFGAVLEGKVSEAGGLPYRAADNLPFGQDWNVAANFADGVSFCSWAARLPGIRLATSFEFPYADVCGQQTSPELARRFGESLAAAVPAFLG